MIIEYLGHSCFKLTESTGTCVVCDPYSEETVGYAMPKVTADAVTVSHHHDDHDFIANVGGNPVIIDKESSFDLPGVEINSVKSFHDGNRGKKRGENVIFKFRMDGIDICHLGDLGEACSLDLIETILPVNVLLIPVGGNYTIDAEMAKEYVDRIMPEIVIPMHFRTKDSKIDIDKLDGFLNLFDGDCIEEKEESSLELSRSDLTEETKIIVLRRA
ncbi:MAG: MBL fold metallo-hydrolase [Clostridia bacterium]|jgi:L-ascorbate metabolism protein UlaG (beta-lactamase superfamily)|nr:MBL fold metallo-hydrolase [Clostridia bacterium]